MAFLRQPKPDDEIKKLTLGNIKKEYSTIASDYGKILERKVLICPRCGQAKTANAFYTDRSYAIGYYPECKDCVKEQGCDYDKKSDSYTDNKNKAMIVLRRMNLPYIDHLFESQIESVKNDTKEGYRTVALTQYITILKSLPQYRDKTFENSEFGDLEGSGIVKTDREVRPKMYKIFGQGFNKEDMLYLQDQYDDWCARTQVDTKAQELYVIRICFKLLDIWKAQRAGRDTKDLDKSLNELMQAANLQPRQNVGNQGNDSLSFGQMIEKWEMSKPCPELEPEFKDIDNIGTYIEVWFLGHLGKCLGLKNVYTDKYDKYIEQYTVRKPDSSDEDSSSFIFEKIFGRSEDS